MRRKRGRGESETYSDHSRESVAAPEQSKQVDLEAVVRERGEDRIEYKSS